MRLFKRRSLDQSPELVSATPISQETNNSNERIVASSGDEIKTATLTTLTTPRRTRSEMQQVKSPKQQSTPSAFSAKSLTTWSRRVGEKLDQLRRTDSSEVLTLSGQRRRISPHKKSTNESLEDIKKISQKTSKLSSSPEFLKPKRISRVESLRNLFKSSSNLKKSTISIKEEDECDESSYRMEKSLSEGALKSVNTTRSNPLDELQNKRWMLSKSIHNLEQQNRALDYFLEHQDILKTQQGKLLAQRTIEKTATIKRRPFSGSAPLMQHRQRTFSGGSNDDLNISGASDNSNEENDFKSNMLDERTTETNKTSMVTGLEDLMSGLKLACDESGYDSDSTRAGADSPDSEKSVGTLAYSHCRTSMNLADYPGVDLSLMPFSTPKKNTSEDEFADQEEEELLQDDTTIVNLNDSSRTDTTILVTEDESEQKQPVLSRITSTDSGMGGSALYHTPETKRTTLQKSRLSCLMTHRRSSNDSILNLLDNAASPCKDSPPSVVKPQGVIARAKNQLQLSNTKRAHSAIETEITPDEVITVQKQIFATPKPAAPFTPRRELKTIKLNVDKLGNIGISVQKCDAARPYYIVASMDRDGVAAKSKLIRVGDEIVRVSGRRLRGMSLIEAKNSLKNCVGAVDIQISREPSLFGTEEIMVRSRSDSEVWGPKMAEGSVVEMKFDSPNEHIVKRREVMLEKSNEEENNRKSCQIIGAVTKDGRTLSIQDMECDADENKVTGMKKFHVRKRSSTMTSGTRRATSLSMDLITVTLEKGGVKRLGFTIVGGSDSKKGPMGIFIKDILAGGQAADQGILKVEDEILAINGMPLEGLSHARVLHIFKTVKKGKIVLHIGRRDQSHKRLLKQQYSSDN